MTKQISLTMPDMLFEMSKKYYQSLGFMNLQEFILGLLRKEVILSNIERYKKIEEGMKKGRAKRFTQKGAVRYLRSL